MRRWWRRGGAQIEPNRKKRAGEQVALAFLRSPRALECIRALISTTPQPMEKKFSIWIHEKFKGLCQREALPKIASLSYFTGKAQISAWCRHSTSDSKSVSGWAANECFNTTVLTQRRLRRRLDGRPALSAAPFKLASSLRYHDCNMCLAAQCQLILIWPKGKWASRRIKRWTQQTSRCTGICSMKSALAPLTGTHCHQNAEVFGFVLFFFYLFFGKRHFLPANPTRPLPIFLNRCVKANLEVEATRLKAVDPPRAETSTSLMPGPVHHTDRQTTPLWGGTKGPVHSPVTN